MVLTDDGAVRNLIGAYCQLLDDRRVAELAALHARDATFEAMGQTFRGPAEIQRFFDDNVPPSARGKHLCFNSVLHLDDDRGTGVTDYAVLVPTEGGFGLTNAAAVGRYHDEFVREDGEWRFASRRIVFFGA
jgi:hypothetical protein